MHWLNWNFLGHRKVEVRSGGFEDLGTLRRPLSETRIDPLTVWSQVRFVSPQVRETSQPRRSVTWNATWDSISAICKRSLRLEYKSRRCARLSYLSRVWRRPDGEHSRDEIEGWWERWVVLKYQTFPKCRPWIAKLFFLPLWTYKATYVYAFDL